MMSSAWKARAGALSGGIQTTGNYPGRARNFEELKADFLKAYEPCPREKRINLHASYACLGRASRWTGMPCSPATLSPGSSLPKENGLGIDFNPTFFSHPLVKDNLTLSSRMRKFGSIWVRHGIQCRRISSYIAQQLGSPVLCNVWIPDGYKDIPADRLGPRLRLKQSLDEIFAEKLPGVIDCVESKVFGIGMEAFTVGSSEFYISYAASHPGVYDLLDNGHYHPTEVVRRQDPSLLAFFDKVPLHVTRGVVGTATTWCSTKTSLKEIAKEIVRNKATDRVLIGLDFFDASINRIAAWVVGTRSMEKALLFALLQPWDQLKQLQDSLPVHSADDAERGAENPALWGHLGALLPDPGGTWGQRVVRYSGAVRTGRAAQACVRRKWKWQLQRYP